MIDLETLGNHQDCAFISIGAVEFDPDMESGGLTNLPRTFYMRVDWESAIKSATIQADTLKWWMVQSQESRQEILKEGEPLDIVLEKFKQWFPEDAIIWGNGAPFDVSILQHSYKNKTPWKFWNVFDVRTIVGVSKGIIERDSFVFTGTKHNALDDAIHQVKYVSAMWKRLRGA